MGRTLERVVPIAAACVALCGCGADSLAKHLPVWAILAAVVAGFVWWGFTRLVRPRREIGSDFFGAEAGGPHPGPAPPPDPREAVPPLPQPGEPRLVAGVDQGQPGQDRTALVVAAQDGEQSAMAAALEEVAAAPASAQHAHGPGKCRVCGEEEDRDAIDLEEWERVDRVWTAMLDKARVPQKLRPKRRRYVPRGWCKRCWRIALDLNGVFMQGLQLELARVVVELDARKRGWELRGLEAAVKRAIENEERRYAAEEREIDAAARELDMIDLRRRSGRL